MRIQPAIFGALLFSHTACAQTTGLGAAAYSISQFCNDLTGILPIISMLLIIAAGLVYAGGQISGSEYRARASTWATAMLIGAVIGILIATVAPAIISAMYGCQVSCGGAFIVGAGLAPC